MSPILTRLAELAERDPRTLADLGGDASLSTTPQTLGRKLRGDISITLDEAEALARATGHELRLVRSRRAK